MFFEARVGGLKSGDLEGFKINKFFSCQLRKAN
jgi:hypothetical protein